MGLTILTVFIICSGVFVLSNDRLQESSKTTFIIILIVLGLLGILFS